MTRSTSDHFFFFYHHTFLGQYMYSIVYVNGIVITCRNQDGIQKLKQHPFSHFQTKDLGKLKYFLRLRYLSLNMVWLCLRESMALIYIEQPHGFVA